MAITVSMKSPSTNCSTVQLQAELDEEVGHQVEVLDGDADVVETLDVAHCCILQVIGLSCTWDGAGQAVLDIGVERKSDDLDAVRR